MLEPLRIRGAVRVWPVMQPLARGDGATRTLWNMPDLFSPYTLKDVTLLETES